MAVDDQIQDKPKPVKYTMSDGGIWRDWDKRDPESPGRVHSIKFDDGSIFDIDTGWRPVVTVHKPSKAQAYIDPIVDMITEELMRMTSDGMTFAAVQINIDSRSLAITGKNAAGQLHGRRIALCYDPEAMES